MGGNNLPGLSALWIISLGMVLGAAIVVMIPVSKSGGGAIKMSDWTGFGGSVVAGTMNREGTSMACVRLLIDVIVSMNLPWKFVRPRQRRLI
jgi:hypothetical protein